MISPAAHAAAVASNFTLSRRARRTCALAVSWLIRVRARHHDAAVTNPSDAGYPHPATRASPVEVAAAADSVTAASATVACAIAASESWSSDPAASRSRTRAAAAVSSPTAACSAGPDGTSGADAGAVLMTANLARGSDSATLQNRPNRL